jgi:hypothetical protein
MFSAANGSVSKPYSGQTSVAILERGSTARKKNKRRFVCMVFFLMEHSK